MLEAKESIGTQAGDADASKLLVLAAPAGNSIVELAQ